MDIIDLHVPLPPDAKVQVEQGPECCPTYSIDVGDPRAVRDKIVALATAGGYSLRALGEGRILRHGERVIEIYAVGRSTLRVWVDDPESLPQARTTPAGISLGSLAIQLSGNYQIRPGRERHDSLRKIWSAEWLIAGLSIDALCDQIAQSLGGYGIRAVVWENGGRASPERKVEGESPTCLVQAYLSPARDSDVMLKIYVMGDVGGR